jgi:hypothetical protein
MEPVALDLEELAGPVISAVSLGGPVISAASRRGCNRKTPCAHCVRMEFNCHSLLLFYADVLTEFNQTCENIY